MAVTDSELHDFFLCWLTRMSSLLLRPLRIRLSAGTLWPSPFLPEYSDWNKFAFLQFDTIGLCSWVSGVEIPLTLEWQPLFSWKSSYKFCCCFIRICNQWGSSLKYRHWKFSICFSMRNHFCGIESSYQTIDQHLYFKMAVNVSIILFYLLACKAEIVCWPLV